MTDSDNEIMFTWVDDYLCVTLLNCDGESIEYELDREEVRKLFEFLKEKLEPIKKITQVLDNLVDIKDKKNKKK